MCDSAMWTDPNREVENEKKSLVQALRSTFAGQRTSESSRQTQSVRHQKAGRLLDVEMVQIECHAAG